MIFNIFPFKNLSFFDGFSIIFQVFSGTPPGGRFWRVPVPIFAQKCDFGGISGFRWGPKSTLGRPLFAKKALKSDNTDRPFPNFY